MVFDHLAEYRHLKDCGLIFLTGLEISDGTLEATTRCVREGAVCAMSLRMGRMLGLLDNDEAANRQTDTLVRPQGQGKWVFTRSFQSFELLQQVRPLLGSSDCIRYRLRDGRSIVFDDNLDYWR